MRRAGFSLPSMVEPWKVVACGALALAGCGDDTAPVGVAHDVGADVGADAGSEAAGLDSTTDALDTGAFVLDSGDAPAPSRR